MDLEMNMLENFPIDNYNPLKLLTDEEANSIVKNSNWTDEQVYNMYRTISDVGPTHTKNILALHKYLKDRILEICRRKLQESG